MSTGAIIGLVIGICVFVGLTITFYWWALNNTKKTNNKDTVTTNPYLKFNHYKKIWFTQNQKPIKIINYNYSEKITHFPFNSDYVNTKEFLIKQNASMSTIKQSFEQIIIYDHMILANWIKCQNKLLKTFDDSLLDYTRENVDYFWGYYQLFCDEYKKMVVAIFMNNILSQQISATLDNKVIDLTNKVEQFNKRFEEITNNIVIRLIKKIQPNQKQEKQDKKSEKTFEFLRYVDDLTQAYQLLEITNTTSDEEVKKAYRKAAMQFHPDRHPNDADKEKMAKINLAYDLIKKIRKL